MLKRAIKKTLRSAGWDIQRYRPSSAAVLERLIRDYAVDTIFDVGANIGQSAESFRLMGYTKKIISFEPVSHLSAQLERKAAADPLWEVERLALSPVPGPVEIHVSGGHAGASSVLEMTDNVKTHAPDQQVVGKERAETATLSAMLEKHYPRGDRCFLKLDVQGYEKNVLDSGLDALHRVIGIKIEMSLVENYVGEMLMFEMLPFLYHLGFKPVSIENGWANPQTGELYQIDCILFRTRP